VDLLHPNAPILQDQICHYSPLAIPIPEVPKTTTRVLPDSEWQIWSCSNLIIGYLSTLIIGYLSTLIIENDMK